MFRSLVSCCDHKRVREILEEMRFRCSISWELNAKAPLQRPRVCDYLRRVESLKQTSITNWIARLQEDVVGGRVRVAKPSVKLTLEAGRA